MSPDDAPARPLHSLLVANRGEIARRIMRTARAMGIATVAVHSDADAGSPHVAEADLAVRLPGDAPADTYLRSGPAARGGGPGRCRRRPSRLRVPLRVGRLRPGGGRRRSGLGGSPARRHRRHGLEDRGQGPDAGGRGARPCPSITVDGDEPPDPAAVEALGWPLLVKASAGGGGRGMRIVAGPGELDEALAGARREAESAFGDGTVFLERYVTAPRHIEVQVLADAHGDVVALFERECSIQRRHQKIIEEAPSPGGRPRAPGPPGRRRPWPPPVPSATSTPAPSSSCSTPAAASPLLPRDEHPAPGRAPGDRGGHRARPGPPAAARRRRGALPARGPRGRGPGPVGHAIEARLYAEDPAAGWLPSTGHRWRRSPSPHGPARRAPVDIGRRARRRRQPPLRPDAGQGDRPRPHPAPRRRRPWPPPWRRPASTASPPTATCWCAPCATPAFVAGATDTGFLDRHGLDVLAAPLADEAPAAPRRGRRPGRPGRPTGRGPGARHRALGLAATTPSDRRRSPIDLGRRAGRRGLPVRPRGTGAGRGGPRRRGARRRPPGGWRRRLGDVDRRRGGPSLPGRAGRRGPYVDGPDGSSPLVEEDRLPGRPGTQLSEGRRWPPCPAAWSGWRWPRATGSRPARSWSSWRP